MLRVAQVLELLIWGQCILHKLDLEIIDFFKSIDGRLKEERLNFLPNVAKVLILGNRDVILEETLHNLLPLFLNLVDVDTFNGLLQVIWQVLVKVALSLC